jgi:hypothetical protein
MLRKNQSENKKVALKDFKSQVWRVFGQKNFKTKSCGHPDSRNCL